MSNLLYQIRATWKAFVRKDYAKAIEMFEKVIANGDGNPGIYTSLARCQMELNDPDAALRSCNNAIDLSPNHYEALKLLSLLHKANHNYEETYVYVKLALANQNKILSEPPEGFVNLTKK